MPQARLPDINTAFNTHRKRAILAIEDTNWTEALGALYAINACLPEEYRVIISNQKYDELTKEDLIAYCNKCKEYTNRNMIKIISVLTSPLEQLITNETTRKMWFCPQCKQENRLVDTNMEQTILAQPYYIGVIKLPPSRTDDIVSHLTYDRVMERWCWTMLTELEQKMAQYREDNWKKEDEYNDMSDVDTSLENQDADN